MRVIYFSKRKTNLELTSKFLLSKFIRCHLNEGRYFTIYYLSLVWIKNSYRINIFTACKKVTLYIFTATCKTMVWRVESQEASLKKKSREKCELKLLTTPPTPSAVTMSSYVMGLHKSPPKKIQDVFNMFLGYFTHVLNSLLLLG